MSQTHHQRVIRSRWAEETLKIIEEGGYTHPAGKVIQIQAQIAKTIAEAKLYAPDELPSIRERMEATIRTADKTEYTVHIHVTAETTLEAAQRLVAKEGRAHVVCLNFASAKNPGGGFLGGSQAQEESLARSSALYPSIVQMEEMYKFNKRLGTCLYSDYMIFSPEVPVFRADDGGLLEEPYCVSMITAPAVNAGVVRERESENVERIAEVMLNRIRGILAVVAEQGMDTIILGAYGCGVFRHNPVEVAEWFRKVIVDENYGSLFERIEFAVLDRKADRRTIGAFRDAFEVK
ncbi:TIGR02452 family protein [Paenibacillus sp. FSL K6-1230]|uniref:TIGR02452 family protein n=1 Tax=Paenibacillus sp. FSL K6-1230 TaxID=2921603 RepID=UPI0030F68615